MSYIGVGRASSRQLNLIDSVFIFTFVTFLADFINQYSLLDAVSPVIGIFFLMILLRFNFNKRGPSSTTSATVSQDVGSNNYLLRSVNVRVAHHTDTDSIVESKVASRRSYDDTA